MEKIYWTMSNGQKIDVDDMSENHLRDTLKMIIRNNTRNTSYTINPYVQRDISEGLDDSEPYDF